MGRGEDYAMEFYSWFKALSENEWQVYAAKNPEPEDWDGYYLAIRQEP